MEDWYIHDAFEFFLNVEAVWPFDIFKVEASK
jgi:hypothetical protein